MSSLPSGLTAVSFFAPCSEIIYVPEDVTDRLEVIAWIKNQVVNDGGFSAIGELSSPLSRLEISSSPSFHSRLSSLAAFWLSHIFKLLPFDETLFAPCLPPIAPKGTLRCVCGPGAVRTLALPSSSPPLFLAARCSRFLFESLCRASTKFPSITLTLKTSTTPTLPRLLLNLQLPMS